MLCRIESILGPIPTHVLDNGKDTPRYYTINHVVYDRNEHQVHVSEPVPVPVPVPEQTTNDTNTDTNTDTDTDVSIDEDNVSKARSSEDQSQDHRQDEGKGEVDVDVEVVYNLLYPKKTKLEKRLHLEHLLYQSPKYDTLENKDERLFVSFVRSMLNLDPKYRPTAIEALQHPWLTHNVFDENDLKELNDSEGRWDQHQQHDEHEHEHEEYDVDDVDDVNDANSAHTA